MNIVTPSFRLDLTPCQGETEAPADARDADGHEDAEGRGGRALDDHAREADVRAQGGWVRVRVRADVCGFRADFEARTQCESLRRFERELGAMQETDARACRAELACDEPGIDLRLEAQATGTIAGHFALESERRGGAWTTLSGTFELDPATLPAIRGSILELLRALER